MATATIPSSNTDRPALKILMLHGYTQSSTLFRAKSAALAKFIKKSFPSYAVSICYPTAPHRLRMPDLPGYESQSLEKESGLDAPGEEEIEAFAWFRRRDESDPPEYLGLEDGLGALAKVLSEEGPFDGVIGFSQGAAMAAMIASLLEPNRADSFTHFTKVASESDGCEIIGGIPFPSSFGPPNLSHPPLKFAICYSGFRAPGPRYRAFYEHPPIRTPVLHILGSLDAVVVESRSRALIDACEGSSEQDGTVVWHPGGHFVPSQLRFLEVPALFIRGCLEGVSCKSKDEEERVEDMEVPF